MAQELRRVNDMESLMAYFSDHLGWVIDPDDYYDIDDITYDFEASDLGLKEEAFAKITSLKQLRPLVDNQRWGIFFVSFESTRFEVSALRKILSGLVPARRNSDHAVWDKKDLLFLCTWGQQNSVTIGVAHFEDADRGLPQIKMISCQPAVEDFTQINVFEQRLAKLAWPDDPTDADAWHDAWASAFTTRYRQTIQDAHTLTLRLAEEAQNIRNRILSTLEIETANGYVHLLFEKFRNTLVHDMTEQQFADMYAQTVVYGLFSARCMDRTQDDFCATEAVECIPNTNPFLKSLLQECLGSNNAKSKLSFDELEVGNIVDLLLHTRTDSIILDFNRQTGGGREDPVIHFYEEFLSEYDKTQRVQRGVYYTPQPVVNFIVRAVDDILRRDFNVADGLASTNTKKIKIVRLSKRRIDGLYRSGIAEEKEVPAIQILDPATGTGTFLRQTILQIYSNFRSARKGMSEEQIQAEWNQYVPVHLLPRLNGFEIMMAPYAVAHMKLAMVLKDTGYLFDADKRLQVYLTNTLEKPGETENQLSLYSDPLAMESISANKAKNNGGINIVIGNPPYAGESCNKGQWILNLLEDYKVEPGGQIKLQERNSKWLSDDYVKFIRYAQELVERAGRGILAFINPHGFISNPTFRGMRWSLMQSFDHIYILDLHGNSNRKETAPDGGKDENVFDIQQGVCIGVFVKKQPTSRTCQVFHANLYGTRQRKYEVLGQSSLEDICFQEVSPKAPDYAFQPVDYDLKASYDQGFSVHDLFTLGSVGVVTARDGLTLGFTPDEILQKADKFRLMEPEEARAAFDLGKDVADWKVRWAQDDLNSNAVVDGKIKPELITPVMYRVFDRRYTVYTGCSRGLICRPRADVMRQFLLGPNLGLATARSNKSDSCDHFYVTNIMMEAKCAERTTQAAIYPLYTYHFVVGQLKRTVNFSEEIVKQFAEHLGLLYSGDTPVHSPEAFSATELFHYIYGYLYSKQYRDKYSRFLKADYPRIPFALTADKFWHFVDCGRALCTLHLMDHPVELTTGVSFVDAGGYIVEKVAFKNNRIYINKKSYFDNISNEQWSFGIGGYLPMQRWYKDRKGRNLTKEDVTWYCQMAEVISRTILIMGEIDGNRQ